MENYFIIQPEKKSKKYIGWSKQIGIYLVTEFSKAKMFEDKLTLEIFAIENNIQFYNVLEISISVVKKTNQLFDCLNHQADVQFNDGNYYLQNSHLPPFILSLAFQDEFEASMAFGLWTQYSKNKKDSEVNYNEFQWIMKMSFRLVGNKSNWK